ncbi:MAG: YihY/virulence factor BrkB family protein, partial [Jatrophihabitans sp.]
PIAALLFFYLLALGVLLGAEFNAEIEQSSPSRARVRRPGRGWRQLAEPAQPEPPAGRDS